MIIPGVGRCPRCGAVRESVLKRGYLHYAPRGFDVQPCPFASRAILPLFRDPVQILRNSKSHTPCPKRSPRASNLVLGRNSGRAA